MKPDHTLETETERTGGSLVAALRRVPSPDADQPRGHERAGPEENQGPALKARAAIAYLGTIVAALVFLVVFLWLGWALLQAYMEWSQQAPPHIRQD